MTCHDCDVVDIIRRIFLKVTTNMRAVYSCYGEIVSIILKIFFKKRMSRMRTLDCKTEHDFAKL